MTNRTQPLTKLRKRIKELYGKTRDALPFHGWHHINFVRHQAIAFGKSIGADSFIVESAALTHDLNYLVRPNSLPEAGYGMRKALLIECGYDDAQISTIENVIIQAHTGYRFNKARSLSAEGKSLSDADTLFKALPITPIVFAHKYLTENSTDLVKLARKIVKEQNPLMKRQVYFYTPLAKVKYAKWARTNLKLWNNVLEAMRDPAVKKLLIDYRIFAK